MMKVFSFTFPQFDVIYREPEKSSWPESSASYFARLQFHINFGFINTTHARACAADQPRATGEHI